MVMFILSRPGALLPCLPSPSYLFSTAVSLLLLMFPPSPFTADAGRCLLLISALDSRHLTTNRSTASGIPCYHFPAFFATVAHNAVSAPNNNGATSVDPSVARNSQRSSTMHLFQVFNFTPGLGFAPPAIAPNINRVGNRSLLSGASPWFLLLLLLLLLLLFSRNKCGCQNKTKKQTKKAHKMKST